MAVRTTVAMLAITALTPMAAAPARGQEAADSSGGTSARAGVYTEGQAEKGQATFRKYCLECHAPASYAGRAFRRAWSGRPAYELFDLIRTRMPNDDPGGLSRGQYVEVLAYLFKLNGLPPGEKSLLDRDDTLKQVRLDLEPASPPPPSPPPPSPVSWLPSWSPGR